MWEVVRSQYGTWQVRQGWNGPVEYETSSKAKAEAVAEYLNSK